jgi:hypothetical protein
MTTTYFLRARTTTLLLTLLTALSASAADKSATELPKGVVARQGGIDVTLDDLNAFAAKIPDKDRAGYFDSPTRIEGTIMSLLLQKQLAAQARAEKLDRDPLVQRQVAIATEDTLARVQLDNFRKKLQQPNFDLLAKEYYDSHQEEFATKGDISVEQILVTINGRTEDQAKARIEEAEKAVLAHPDQFEGLVEKYSDDPNKAVNHGLIERAGGTKAPRPFALAANALTTPGQISPVVRLPLGFCILKLIERKPDYVRPFDEAKRELVTKLRTNYVDAQMTQYTGELRGKPLQADPDLVASLRTRYMPAGTQSPEEAAAAAASAKTSSQPTEPAH